MCTAISYDHREFMDELIQKYGLENIEDFEGSKEIRFKFQDRIDGVFGDFRAVALCSAAQVHGIQVQLAESRGVLASGDVEGVRGRLTACYQMAGEGTADVEAGDVPRPVFALLHAISEELGDASAASALAGLMGGESAEEPASN